MGWGRVGREAKVRVRAQHTAQILWWRLCCVFIVCELSPLGGRSAAQRSTTQRNAAQRTAGAHSHEGAEDADAHEPGEGAVPRGYPGEHPQGVGWHRG